MTDDVNAGIDHQELLRMTTDIVSSFVTNNSIPSESLPDLIRNVHATVSDISGGAAEPEVKKKPAVPISKSVTDDFIICLEDGKKLKMLKRYLRSQFDMSPEDYRRKWNLPADYPMVAPNYSKRRSQFAKQIGLGKGGKAAAKKK
jgi:predicted transcriptional regulator